MNDTIEILMTTDHNDVPGTAAEPQAPPVRLTRVKRVFILAAALFTIFHIFASFLWIAPASGLRELFPGNSLQRYMIPMFGQSWSVFAPNPINGDYRFQVRAVVSENGELIETEWVDTTAAEPSMHVRNPFPPRAAMTSHDLSSRFKGAYDALNDGQKEVVGLGYYKGDDWAERMEAALRDNGDTDAVDKYIAMERWAIAYATQVAYAIWGDDVVHVQFISSRQNVIPYAERNNPDAERPGVQTAPLGWRGTIEEDGQSRINFQKTFLRGLEKSGQVQK